MQRQITMAICVLLFQLGFMIYEYGQARSKSADSTLIKHLFLFFTAAIVTFLTGYAMAYGLIKGKQYMVGTQHFLSTGIEKDTFNSTAYMLMIPKMSLIATVSVSSLNERQSVFAQVLLGIFLQLILIPIILAWTHNDGFLKQLFLQDQTGCISIHLLSGISAMISCAIIQPRLGKFQPLTQLQNFDSDTSDGEEKVVLSSAAILHKKSQRKIDKVARGLDMQLSGRARNMNIQVEKVRRAVREANTDSFFSHNSTLSMLVGTLLMWWCLAQFSAGY